MYGRKSLAALAVNFAAVMADMARLKWPNQLVLPSGQVLQSLFYFF
jgi:hypothetical protein